MNQNFSFKNNLFKQANLFKVFLIYCYECAVKFLPITLVLIILIPLVAFDKQLNRLGYGGGYYDRLIKKISKKKNILKIGLALSVQKNNNIPINEYDKKLDYILTDKYII